MKNEPVALGGAVIAVVEAGLGVAAAYNLPVTQPQQTAIIGFTVAVVALTCVIVGKVRSRVTPAGKVVEYVERAGGREQVIAGEASDRLAPGEVVREIDTGADGVDDTPRRSAE